MTTWNTMKATKKQGTETNSSICTVLPPTIEESTGFDALLDAASGAAHLE